MNERLSDQLRDALRRSLGDRLREGVPLAAYTSARIGGPADYLVEVRSADELAEAVQKLWHLGAAFRVLGGGTNVLISDRGVRGVVILNRARAIRFEDDAEPLVWAESGAGLGTVSRLAAERGLAGLEWAATVPGTVGGAVVGNAGAHGGDVAGTLQMAEILQHPGVREMWPAAKLGFAYRSSVLKRNPGSAVVLGAGFRLTPSTPQACKEAMQRFAAHREQSQPHGASMGSMFKNPPGDYAGRLIEAAGLKGRHSGKVKISEQHANFFINEGGASAADVRALIETAQREVLRTSGVALELEIELVGEWGSEESR